MLVLKQRFMHIKILIGEEIVNSYIDTIIFYENTVFTVQVVA
jgi:hypothetical protein